MAYFPNGTSGMVFEDQCSKCKYGKASCPIAVAQYLYNYESANNEIATKILEALVKDDGTCSMWKAFKRDFEIDPNQVKLF